MKGISSIIAILGLCVIVTVKAAPVDDINTGSDKEKNITDIINNLINAKVHFIVASSPGPSQCGDKGLVHTRGVSRI